MRHRVVVLALDGVIPFELGIPQRIFGRTRSAETPGAGTFTRRFREEVGVSPGQWLAQQRVERAQHLLESTGLSIGQVARDAGFGTATSLRQHVQAAPGVSPTAYRRTFRSAVPGR